MDENADPWLLAHAYMDGELGLSDALAFERRRDADPRLAALCNDIAQLRHSLRDKLPSAVASAALRSRVESIARRREHSAQPSWRALAASVVVAAVLAGGSGYLVATGGSGDRLDDALIAAHRRALLAAQPTDVASSDRHTVKPWFNTRIAQAPRVVDLTAAGFPLLGGRVDVIAGAPAPTLVYRHRQHLISLTAVPQPTATRAASRREQDGYRVVEWRDGGTRYAAVSDLDRAEIETFANAFRAAQGED